MGITLVAVEAVWHLEHMVMVVLVVVETVDRPVSHRAVYLEQPILALVVVDLDFTLVEVTDMVELVEVV